MPAYKVTLPDEEFLFEPDEMQGSEWGAVEAETGSTFEEWTDGIDKRLWVPCQTLVWFLRTKAGAPCERREVDFKIRQLKIARVPDPKDQAATRRSAPGTGSRSSKRSESDPPTSTS